MKIAALAFAVVAATLWAQNNGDPVIEKARQSAAAYGQSLPDYIVKRTTTRHIDDNNTRISRALDIVTADVAVEHGKDVYANIRVNGVRVTDPQHGGAWSVGEVSGTMVSVLAPARAAVFTNQRPETIGKHPSWRYDFAIDKAHSAWDVAAATDGHVWSGGSYFPAYSGRIWIDKASGQMLSVEMSARDLPAGFPLSTLYARTDYDFVRIGHVEYLLPTHSRTVSCTAGGAICNRNESDFHNYDKFTASSSITFGKEAK